MIGVQEPETQELVWTICNDCGESFLSPFTHELTCPGITGLAHSSPIIDGELVGSCELPPPEPGEGLEVEYQCYVCHATVKQDASEDMTIDERGNPVCSKLCGSVAKSHHIAEDAATSDKVKAIRAYVAADVACDAFREACRARSAAAKAVIEIVGIGGHFADEAGTVYEISPVKGKYIEFVPYEVMRTRRGTEKRGSLSLERAEELGYDVMRKIAKPRTRKPTVIKTEAPPVAPVAETAPEPPPKPKRSRKRADPYEGLQPFELPPDHPRYCPF